MNEFENCPCLEDIMQPRNPVRIKSYARAVVVSRRVVAPMGNFIGAFKVLSMIATIASRHGIKEHENLHSPLRGDE